jgi:hypothetical protein
MASIAPMIMTAAASMIRIERFMITASDDLHTYSPNGWLHLRREAQRSGVRCKLLLGGFYKHLFTLTRLVQGLLE